MYDDVTLGLAQKDFRRGTYSHAHSPVAWLFLAWSRRRAGVCVERVWLWCVVCGVWWVTNRKHEQTGNMNKELTARINCFWVFRYIYLFYRSLLTLSLFPFSLLPATLVCVCVCVCSFSHRIREIIYQRQHTCEDAFNPCALCVWYSPKLNFN